MKLEPINIFKFLEKKDNRPIPFNLKLIHELPLTPEELNIKGDLKISPEGWGSKSDALLASLPAGLKVKGNVDVRGSQLASLPDNLEVGGDLWLDNTPIASLPDNLKVGTIERLAYLQPKDGWNSVIKTFVKDGLRIDGTQINSIPNNLEVGGDFELRDTPLAVQYMKQHNNNPDEAKSALQRDIESKGGKIGGTIII
jgi:hypothetical protein